MPIRLLSLMLLLALPAHAAGEALPSSSASFIQMILGLGFTLALLFAGLYVLRRLQGPAAHGRGALRMLGSMGVGPRERVVLLGVADKVLVLGVSPGRINTLHTLQADELPPPEAPAPVPGGDFARRLARMLEQRRES